MSVVGSWCIHAGRVSAGTLFLLTQRIDSSESWEGMERREEYIKVSATLPQTFFPTPFFSNSQDETTRVRNNSTPRLFVQQGFLLLPADKFDTRDLIWG